MMNRRTFATAIAAITAGVLMPADLRHDRGSAPDAARFPRDLQRHLADRTAWLHHASGLSAETASTRGSGRIGFNSVSQQPRAVQATMQ